MMILLIDGALRASVRSTRRLYFRVLYFVKYLIRQTARLHRIVAA